MAVLLTGCIATPSPKTSSQEPANEPIPLHAAVDSFRWESQDARGNLALGIRVASDDDNTCKVLFNATGKLMAPGHGYMEFIRNSSGPVQLQIGTEPQFSLLPPPIYVRAHGGPAAQVVDPTGRFPARWLTRGETSVGLHGENKSFEAFFGMVGLQPVEPAEPSYVRGPMGNNTVVLGINCVGPFRLDALSGSREVLLFHEGSMREGAGVHASVFGDPSGAGVLQVSSLGVKSAAGVMAASIWGDILTMQAGAGVARITYPGGTDLWVDRPRNVFVDCAVLNICSRSDYMRAYDGGAGEYRFELSFGSVDATAHVYGGMLGLSPVPDFGALLAPDG